MYRKHKVENCFLVPKCLPTSDTTNLAKLAYCEVPVATKNQVSKNMPRYYLPTSLKARRRIRGKKMFVKREKDGIRSTFTIGYKRAIVQADVKKR